MARKPPRSDHATPGGFSKDELVSMLVSGHVKDFNLWHKASDGIAIDLSYTKLIRAELSHADFSGANLAGANLMGSRFAGANLAGANLTGATAADAELADATGLTQEQLNSMAADTPAPASLPPGLEWPHAYRLAPKGEGARLAKERTIPYPSDMLGLSRAIDDLGSIDVQQALMSLGPDKDLFIQQAVVDALERSREDRALRADPVDRGRLSDPAAIAILDHVETTKPESDEAKDLSLQALNAARDALDGFFPVDRPRTGTNQQELPVDAATFDTLTASLAYATRMHQPPEPIRGRARSTIRAVTVVIAEITALLAATAAGLGATNEALVQILELIEKLKLAVTAALKAFGI